MDEPRYFVLSPSLTWTRGFLVGRFPRNLGFGEHLPRSEVNDEVTSRDTVVIIGGWDDGLSRVERVWIEKRLHDSGARILNGAGAYYSWGSPPPWEHDGNEPGSAITTKETT